MGLFAACALNGDGHEEQCMGACYGTEKEKCRVGWSTYYKGKDCKISDKLLLRYYTEYSHGVTVKCMSDCAHFGGYYKPWCVNEDNWWLCVKEIPRNVTRKIPNSGKYQYYHCLEGCTDGWCDTYPNSWKYCDPSKTVFVSDNPTEVGTRCVTRCGVWGENIFKCYDTKKKWVNCYPSPDGTKIVKSFHQYAEKHKHTFNERGQLVSCDTISRKRRNSDYDNADVDDFDMLKLESRFNGHNSVEEMATRLEAIFTTETLRWPTPQVSGDLSDNPILQYTVRIIPTPFNKPQIILPMVVKAMYSTYTRATNRLSTYDEVNYSKQDPKPDLNDHDYIIPYSLGGTNDSYNIVPQSSALNQDGPWGRLERIIRDYITSHPTGTVDHIVVINYNFTKSYRPTSFGIRVRFYDADRQLVDENGQRLNSFSDNIYEEFYLINEESPCGNDSLPLF
ncbi:unnamed protein product [Spodoptera littoralis]|uniref:Type VII secretion system protein EssD-like domain-containing protein n=1 Tax=Spodoptera littoralis TaxID=7109 RepID=A0A9P0N975_SPOLI|nr:unnamed protein product [Spodoptera littoralis]CAH1644376.1 unnamed protein product [Spodoptera littoralis]